MRKQKKKRHQVPPKNPGAPKGSSRFSSKFAKVWLIFSKWHQFSLVSVKKRVNRPLPSAPVGTAHAMVTGTYVLHDLRGKGTLSSPLVGTAHGYADLQLPIPCNAVLPLRIV